MKRPSRPVQQSAENFHPRQTIISIPVRVTHPRQTLIRPDAPPAPPKIVTPLPNIVEWSGATLQRPHLHSRPPLRRPSCISAPWRTPKRPNLRTPKQSGSHRRRAFARDHCQAQARSGRHVHIDCAPPRNPHRSGRGSQRWRGRPAGRQQLAQFDRALRHARSAGPGGKSSGRKSRRPYFDFTGGRKGRFH